MEEINDIEEYIDYTCSTGSTPESNIFTKEERLRIEKATNSSDKKLERLIRIIFDTKVKEIK